MRQWPGSSLIQLFCCHFLVQPEPVITFYDNCKVGNKHQWTFNQNTLISIFKIAIECVVCKISMIFIFEAFSRQPGATFPALDGCNVCACGNNGRPAMCTLMACPPPTLQWRHNECNGVSNRRRLDCLPNRLLRHSSKKPPKLRVTGLCEGNSPANSPHKGPVTRKMFPFDDVMRLKQQHKPYRSWWISSGELRRQKRYTLVAKKRLDLPRFNLPVSALKWHLLMKITIYTRLISQLFSFKRFPSL